MNRYMWALGGVVSVAVCGVAYTIGPPDTSGVQPTAAPKNIDEEMAKARASMMPGPVHARLAKLAGDWAVTTVLSVPGRPDQTTQGTSKISMVLGGRFVHDLGEGIMMGQPFSSNRSWGYNNGSGKYEAVWSYSMGTGFLYMKGESKDDGKTIDWVVWWDNEVGVREEMKGLTTFISDDAFSFKMYGGVMPDGTPGPVMLETYARVKK